MYHLICSIIVYIFITKFDAFHPVCQELRYQPRSASRLHGPAAQKHAPARSWKRLIWKTLTRAMHPSQRFMRWSTGRSQWAIMKSLLIAAETHTTRTIRKDMICPKFVSCDESMPHVFLAILNTTFVLLCQWCHAFLFVAYLFIVKYHEISIAKKTRCRIFTPEICLSSVMSWVPTHFCWHRGVSNIAATRSSWRLPQNLIFESSHHLTSVGTGKMVHGPCRPHMRHWRRIFMTFYNIQLQW